MKSKWKKYLDIFKNADKIADGIANAIVKRDYLDVFVDSTWI